VASRFGGQITQALLGRFGRTSWRRWYLDCGRKGCFREYTQQSKGSEPGKLREAGHPRRWYGIRMSEEIHFDFGARFLSRR
jgi:hypothetical protein